MTRYGAQGPPKSPRPHLKPTFGHHERSHVKLSRISRYSAIDYCCLAIVATLMTACATAPGQAVVERLDPDTATTLTVLNKPVEMVAETLHNAGGDPFAFLGPFETNRMGNRVQYLWISAPSVENAKIEPQLMCDGQPLTLSPVDSDVAHLGLSRPPYEKPAPWSLQWYFQLPADTLRCLSDAHRVTLETHADNGQSDHFSVESKGLATLKAFSTY
jgi:hypothetical protein